jgi:hypothetical protein
MMPGDPLKRARAKSRARAMNSSTAGGHITKNRIYGIASQVLDELDRRNKRGKGDIVARLADEVEKGGLAAWRELAALLPKDDPQPAPQQSWSAVWIQLGEEAQRRRNTLDAKPTISLIPPPEAPAEFAYALNDTSGHGNPSFPTNAHQERSEGQCEASPYHGESSPWTTPTTTTDDTPPAEPQDRAAPRHAG